MMPWVVDLLYLWKFGVGGEKESGGKVGVEDFLIRQRGSGGRRVRPGSQAGQAAGQFDWLGDTGSP